MSLDNIISQITGIAEAVNRRRALYDRSRAIGADGSIPARRLEGMIDVMKTRLSSAVSNWYTDADGNLILESVNGLSAMKLCGEGFMIASARTDDGAWDWRTFGTGEGFTADMLVTGFLSADRIQAGSVTANKLAADVGASLDLSSNVGINLRVDGIKANIDRLRSAAVSNVQVLYALGTSSSTAPIGGWSAEAPDWEDGRFMRQKTVTTYATGATEESAPTFVASQRVSVSVEDKFGNKKSQYGDVLSDEYEKITFVLENEVINAETSALRAAVKGQSGARAIALVNGERAGSAFELNGDSGVTWQIDASVLNLSDEGKMTLSFEYAEGHSTKASNVKRVTIDRVPPVLDADLSDVSSRTTQISDSTEPGATVTLSVDGATYTDVAGISGAVAFNDLRLENGQTVVLSVVDAVGNAGEALSTTVGEREGGGMRVAQEDDKLIVSGWVILAEADKWNLAWYYDGNKAPEGVNLEQMTADEMVQVESNVNEAGKSGYHIKGEIDISKLSGGEHTLELMVDEFDFNTGEAKLRALDSFVFETEDRVIQLLNPEPDGESGRFAFGLDAMDSMNSKGILLTGWYYGAADNSNYTITEARVVDIYTDAEVDKVALNDLRDALKLGETPQLGYMKLPRAGVSASSAAGFALGGISTDTSYAGFMVYIDTWNLKDGNYKVVLTVQSGGEKYHPSAQLTINGGAASISASDIQRIANRWAPVVTPAATSVIQP